MSLNKLEHFLIRANNLEETRAFYQDVLGLRDGDRPPFEFPGNWLYLGDVPCVHLVEEGFDRDFDTYMGRDGDGGGTRTHEDTGPIDHIAFNANDLKGMQKRFADLGVETREQAVEGLHQIFLKDPNGITVELNFQTGSSAE